MQQELEAAACRAREELRLVQQRADEMKMRKEIEEEEERLSCTGCLKKNDTYYFNIFFLNFEIF